MSKEEPHEEIKKHYDKTAPVWRSKVWINDEEFRDKIVEFADIGRGAEILDVGIGAGDLAGLFKVKLVTGVDISQGMLNECRKLHPDFELFCCDAQTMPFNDDSFDVVCSRNLMQNFENPEPAFKEIVRVLKPGGKIFIIESAVYEKECPLVTEFCRISEPFCPPFPSHESLYGLFSLGGVENVKREIVSLRRKWFQKQQKSKGATEEQKARAYKLCEDYPDWYKEKYQFKFFPEEKEIESILTFSFLRGKKRAI